MSFFYKESHCCEKRKQRKKNKNTSSKLVRLLELFKVLINEYELKEYEIQSSEKVI